MPTHDQQLDVLLLTDVAPWPLDHGGKVRTFHLARALRDRGLRVGLAAMEPLPPEAPDDLRQMLLDWPGEKADDLKILDRGWAGPARALRWRLARYMVEEPRRLAGAIRLVKRHRPAAVLGLSLNSAMMLRALQGLAQRKELPPTRHVWYVADELVYFHLSCLRREPAGKAPARLRKLAEHLALERLFARGLDGAAGVSPLDSRLFKIIAGVRDVATVPNGVDLEYFTPSDANATNPQRGSRRSLIFWGRMDFEPNVDAVCWFARHVWPKIRGHWPDATWQIVGKCPAPAVAALASIPGIEVTGEVADVRPYARAAAAAILPMRCGLGIKNKLLEAAAMGRPVLASPLAVAGLEVDSFSPPYLVCRSAAQWVQTICRLWNDAALQADLSSRGLQWVRAHYTWAAAGGKMERWLASMPGPELRKASAAVHAVGESTKAGKQESTKLGTGGSTARAAKSRAKARVSVPPRRKAA